MENFVRDDQEKELVPTKKESPGVGAAIGSVIVVIILIAGAVYILNKVLTTSKDTSEVSSVEETIFVNETDKITE